MVTSLEMVPATIPLNGTFQVKSLHISPISESMTEEAITKHFESHGKIEKVVKIKDFAFVHMSTREEAAKAKENVEKILNGVEVKISIVYS